MFIFTPGRKYNPIDGVGDLGIATPLFFMSMQCIDGDDDWTTKMQ